MVKFEEVKELLIRKGFYFVNAGDVYDIQFGHWDIMHPAITDPTVHLGSIYRDSLYLHEKLYNWDSRASAEKKDRDTVRSAYHRGTQSSARRSEGAQEQL